MSKYFVRAALVACLSTLVAISVAAQDSSSFKSDGVKSQASGPDSNIKNNSALNSEDQKIPAPESKGGPKAKGGAACVIDVNNETPYIVGVYMNGDYEGTVARWGNGYMPITSGVAILYARADFDDGSVVTFGPREFRCVGGAFTWTLGR